jgi:hypothetical protein
MRFSKVLFIYLLLLLFKKMMSLIGLKFKMETVIQSQDFDFVGSYSLEFWAAHSSSYCLLLIIGAVNL